MPSICNLSTEERSALVVRLRKIEGQAKGIQRMIEDGRDCLDVMTQIVAMRAAATSVAGELIEDVALRCLRHPEEFASPEEAVEQAVQVLVRGGR